MFPFLFTNYRTPANQLIFDKDLKDIHVLDFIKGVLKCYDSYDHSYRRNPYYYITQDYSTGDPCSWLVQKYPNLHKLRCYVQVSEKGHCGYCSEASQEDSYESEDMEIVHIAIPDILIGNLFDVKIDDINEPFLKYKCWCGGDQSTCVVKNFRIIPPNSESPINAEPVLFPKSVWQGSHKIIRRFPNKKGTYSDTGSDSESDTNSDYDFSDNEDNTEDYKETINNRYRLLKPGIINNLKLTLPLATLQDYAQKLNININLPNKTLKNKPKNKTKLTLYNEIKTFLDNL